MQVWTNQIKENVLEIGKEFNPQGCFFFFFSSCNQNLWIKLKAVVVMANHLSQHATKFLKIRLCARQSECCVCRVLTGLLYVVSAATTFCSLLSDDIPWSSLFDTFLGLLKRLPSSTPFSTSATFTSALCLAPH